MTSANRFDQISNTKLAFASVVFFGLLLTFFSLFISEIVSGQETTRSLLYTAATLLLGGGVLFGLFTVPRYIWAVYAIAVIFGLETLFAATFAVKDKRHHAASARANYEYALYVDRYEDRFSHHPMLAGVPTPNYSSKDFEHTALSTRVTTAPKDPDAPTILTIGGSTTYGGRNNSETWSSLLATRANLNVINMGVLGYSSAEHVMQTAFWAPEHNPRCAVYYVGWNDLRSAGVNDVKPDYSGFHLKRQGMMLGVSPHAFKLYEPTPLEYVALYAGYINWRRNKLNDYFAGDFPWWRDVSGSGTLTSTTDEKALNYFIQNMKTIIAINEARGVRTILIPQIMNVDHLTEEEARPWTPFLSAKAMKSVIDEYNRALIALSEAQNVWALDHVLDRDWQDAHFVDEGHFSRAGSDAFATAIADDIAALCR